MKEIHHDKQEQAPSLWACTKFSRQEDLCRRCKNLLSQQRWRLQDSGKKKNVENVIVSSFCLGVITSANNQSTLHLNDPSEGRVKNKLCSSLDFLKTRTSFSGHLASSSSSSPPSFAFDFRWVRTLHQHTIRQLCACTTLQKIE